MCVVCFADDWRTKTGVRGVIGFTSRSSVALVSHLVITCQTNVIELIEFVVHASKANKSMEQ